MTPENVSQSGKNLIPEHPVVHPGVFSLPILHLDWESPTPVPLGTPQVILLAAESKINPGFCWQNPAISEELGAITSDKWVLETLEKGYQIPFTSTPIQHKIPQTPQFSATEA